ncbi:unnamed protein product [Mytilus coruscus]|uniref:Uncharacterized protein n=1 Tax=Mytilus coruscus TaxID=42192 RepID=A0A6J8BVM2_MYTCO|nr:unnamed protein product [Mytilus coruscus]
MSQFQTATAQSHLPVPSVYPTTTATTTNHHIISSNFTDAFNNAYKHSLYTAEPLDQPLNTQSPSIPPQLICHPIYQLMWRECRDYEAFSPGERSLKGRCYGQYVSSSYNLDFKLTFDLAKKISDEKLSALGVGAIGDRICLKEKLKTNSPNIEPVVHSSPQIHVLLQVNSR